ncbi:hypothetical protein BOTBODRAFT_156441 [Botryobasidium botryosum FD-172 SS1]|uniref:Uncharacterized protein n=1 Tax=Botryobasidium botryosum (strain FD-172 SS1) TaxID=930990 RepID=A0A067MZW9_BOTB1|nr:hypothetical protein BOTBODRAFT_156441 [Botryobasidium botryosum FD-172 SS1]
MLWISAFLVPGGFSYVEEIVLSGVKLVDRSLVRIVNLPRLAILWLDNTGIGDEGVHYLAALEPTLEELLLCDNPRITDAAIPTLSMLVAGSLRALNLRATGVGMPGIRALSKCIRDNDALVLVDIPEECEVYLHTLDTQYVVHPAAPLISDPRDVDALPTRALRINLQTHALQNTDISWQGTRRDLIDRLTTLLERRRDDFCARKAILGFEQEDDGL